MPVSNTPLISVITICRNADASIEKTLQSVMTQKYVNGKIEHIVIDGASTDRTLEFVKRYPGVRWISEPDDGIADAFNKGISLSIGRYLLYLNADDYLFDEKVLSDVVNFIHDEKHPDWIVGNVFVSEEMDGEKIISAQRRSLRPTCWSLIFRNRICHQAVFLKHKILVQAGGFNTKRRWAMDYDLWQRLCAKGYKPTFFPRVISVYNLEGYTSKRIYQQLEERTEVIERLRNNIIKRFVGTIYDMLKGKKGRYGL